MTCGGCFDSEKGLPTAEFANPFDSWVEEIQSRMSFGEVLRSVNDYLRSLLDEVDEVDSAEYLPFVESLIDSAAWENYLISPELYETLLRLTIRRVSSIGELDSNELKVIYRILEQNVPCNDLISRYRTTIKSILEWS